MVNSAYYMTECCYCHSKTCKNCPLPYTDITLEELTATLNKSKISENVEIELVFLKDVDKAQKAVEKVVKTAASGIGAITIEDCFRIF